MCGIFAQIGNDSSAAHNTVAGLKQLEYRGYDSWGVAWLPSNNPIQAEMFKEIGKIGEAELPPGSEASIALGHTRWATHGGVTRANAHPHFSYDRSVIVVHNGIIENFQELRQELTPHQIKCISETDSEIAAHLIALELKTQTNKDFPQAVASVFSRLSGLNALVVLHPETSTLVAVRKGSPLVIGKSKRGFFVASDSTALAPYKPEIAYLLDNQMAILQSDSLSFRGVNSAEPVDLVWEKIEFSNEDISKGNFDSFLLKELSEQPLVLRAIATSESSALTEYAEWLHSGLHRWWVGCGSAYHAGMFGQALWSLLQKQTSQVVSGSEFSRDLPSLLPTHRVTFLSQSGETIDIVEHLSPLEEAKVPYGSLVNRLGSTLERRSQRKILLGAGPEQCVIATKSFTAKAAWLYLLAMSHTPLGQRATDTVKALANVVESIVKPEYREQYLQTVAEKLAQQQHIFIVGRGICHSLALEAALKIKEVTYVHAEGFAGGELKHGVIALVEPGTPCIILAPPDTDETQGAYAAMISNAIELKSRGAWVVGISDRPNEAFDVHIPVPSRHKKNSLHLLAGLAQGVAVQQLAYLMAKKLGNDPDKPRNLAKSVTVR